MPTDEIDWREHPIAWMSELLIAIERAEYARAENAKQELLRLGWRVEPTTAKRIPKKRNIQSRTLPTRKEGA
jgi:hypothetical protein